jgi:hypothetical protein
LACAASLTALGRSALVLEKGESLADSWHRHYDRLQLHTHKKHSGLPGRPIPREMSGLPTLSIAIAQQYLPYRWVDTMNAPFLRLRFANIGKCGLEWSQHGPLTTIMEKGRTPLINIGTMESIKSGARAASPVCGWPVFLWFQYRTDRSSPTNWQRGGRDRGIN